MRSVTQGASSQTSMRQRTRRTYHTRLREAMMHASRYAFEGQSRLAADSGLSRLLVCRLLAGKHEPRYSTVHSVIAALEIALDCRLDARELISYDGTYERPICAVVGCPGCLPECSLKADGGVDPAFSHVKPGTWMSFRDFETALDKRLERRTRP